MTESKKENEGMTSYEWWLSKSEVERIRLITHLHRESLGLDTATYILAERVLNTRERT